MFLNFRLSFFQCSICKRWVVLWNRLFKMATGVGSVYSACSLFALPQTSVKKLWKFGWILCWKQSESIFRVALGEKKIQFRENVLLFWVFQNDARPWVAARYLFSLSLCMVHEFPSRLWKSWILWWKQSESTFLDGVTRCFLVMLLSVKIFQFREKMLLFWVFQNDARPRVAARYRGSLFLL